MNRRPLTDEQNRVHGREGESEEIPRETPAEEEERETDREASGGAERDRTPQYRDTREEMERGCEGKDGGKGHWTVSFRDGY